MGCIIGISNNFNFSNFWSIFKIKVYKKFFLLLLKIIFMILLQYIMIFLIILYFQKKCGDPSLPTEEEHPCQSVTLLDL